MGKLVFPKEYFHFQKTFSFINKKWTVYLSLIVKSMSLKVLIFFKKLLLNFKINMNTLVNNDEEINVTYIVI